ncbi:uncharacterized protein LOC129594541 [Paramacrobiotus metropolitanus]|uniref:uncharacterized protein LOC129594541 n=1 Tax=Paramacrobiotus metropolitanus TaxID=2943436 RepID=UPI0024461A32|nr:uncharacterized protein LOC129594541 [Paramacrobiotus metropolitanus]
MAGELDWQNGVVTDIMRGPNQGNLNNLAVIVDRSAELYRDIPITLQNLEVAPALDIHFLRIMEALAVACHGDIPTIGKELHSAIVLERWDYHDIVSLGEFLKRWRVKEEVIKSIMLPGGLRWRTGNDHFRVVFVDAFLCPFAVGADRDAELFMRLALHCGIPKLANVVNTEHLIADGAYSFQRARDCTRSCEHHI